MILRLFYRACRLLSYVAIAFLVIIVLSRLLPAAGNLFHRITGAIASLSAGFVSVLDNLKK